MLDFGLVHFASRPFNYSCISLQTAAVIIMNIALFTVHVCIPNTLLHSSSNLQCLHAWSVVWSFKFLCVLWDAQARPSIYDARTVKRMYLLHAFYEYVVDWHECNYRSTA